MVNEIGMTAGDIWQALNQRGEMTLLDLAKVVRTTDPLLFWGVGWLAREQKVDIWADGPTYRIRLRHAHDLHA